jgi:5-(carboxyamino)imidazole ribonucleotide mutase
MTINVGIIMGSRSDWDTMQHASATLDKLGIAHEVEVVSAHRTPDKLFEYAAGAAGRGLQVIIAGAGGAAKALNGMDSLLSIAQMPAGIPVGTMAIGKPGAINAALLAAAILANDNADIAASLEQFRREQTDKVLGDSDPTQ